MVRVLKPLPWFGHREVHRIHLAQARAMKLWQEYVDGAQDFSQ